MSDFSRFLPERLFPSAMEEILFSGPRYIMRADDASTAKRLATKWNTYLLSHELGLAFEAAAQDAYVVVALSEIGREAIRLAGYSIWEMSYIGMVSGLKERFIDDFTLTLKAHYI